MLDELDKKYLITDIIEFSQSMEDDFYYHIMRICNKAMLDEIYQEKENDWNIRNILNNGFMI